MSILYLCNSSRRIFLTSLEKYILSRTPPRAFHRPLHIYTRAYKPTHTYANDNFYFFIFFQGRQRKNVPAPLGVTYELEYCERKVKENFKNGS